MSVNEIPQTVQELLQGDLFETGGTNETVEILEFIRQNGVPLTEDQVRASFLLKEMELGDISAFAISMRPMLTPTKKFFTLLDKLTLADRIKGNAKLGSILKANANPANSVAKADGK